MGLPKQNLVPRLEDFLDRPEPLIQPDVAIADVLPTGELSVRRYGTGRVQAFNRNWTGSNPLDGYSDKVKQAAWTDTKKALKHPCGLRATLLFESSTGGQTITAVATVLPLLNEKPGVQSFLQHEYLITPLAKNEFPALAVEYEADTYIDIGAGVPD